MVDEAVVLGALLVVGTLVGPLAPFDGGDEDLRLVQGEVLFSTADYTGNSTVEAQEALVRVVGDSTAHVNASKATVRVYTQEQVRAQISGENGVVGGQVKDTVAETNSSREIYTNVSIRVEGDADGLLHLWPNETLGTAKFSIGLGPSQTPTIAPSGNATNITSTDGRFSYDIGAPVFALGPEKWRAIPFEPAVFSKTQANGELDLVIQRSQVEIEEDGERHRLTVGDRERAGDPEDTVDVRKRSYAAITLEDARLTLDTDSADTFLLANEPAWAINGSVRFEALDGEIRTVNESRQLTNDTVIVEGDSKLSLRALGQNDELDVTDPVGDYRLLREVNPETRAETIFSSEATEATVNGQSLSVPEKASIPDEVTFWGRIVGLLLLGVSVLKKLSGFIVALFVEDPLDNERRQKIFDYLRGVGMAHQRAIHRATGIPVASLTHHIETLRNAGLVTKVEENGYTVFFVAESDLCHDERRRLALLADDTRNRIAKVLADRGGASQKQIAEALGLSQGAISKQINKLCEASLVEKHGGWPKEYRASSLVREWFS